MVTFLCWSWHEDKDYIPCPNARMLYHDKGCQDVGDIVYLTQSTSHQPKTRRPASRATRSWGIDYREYGLASIGLTHLPRHWSLENCDLGVLDVDPAVTSSKTTDDTSNATSHQLDHPDHDVRLAVKRSLTIMQSKSLRHFSLIICRTWWHRGRTSQRQRCQGQRTRWGRTTSLSYFEDHYWLKWCDFVEEIPRGLPGSLLWVFLIDEFCTPGELVVSLHGVHVVVLLHVVLDWVGQREVDSNHHEKHQRQLCGEHSFTFLCQLWKPIISEGICLSFTTYVFL